MKQTLAIFLFSLFSFASFATDGDWVTVKGKVVDSKNKTVLIGAKVTFVGIDKVVYTDPDGNFDIEVPKELIKNIRIEYISYETKEFAYSAISNSMLFELPSR